MSFLKISCLFLKCVYNKIWFLVKRCWKQLSRIGTYFLSYRTVWQCFVSALQMLFYKSWTWDQPSDFLRVLESQPPNMLYVAYSLALPIGNRAGTSTPYWRPLHSKSLQILYDMIFNESIPGCLEMQNGI